MVLLPPHVLGPLSECSRAVIVSNVSPGATVMLLAGRQVGKKTVTGTKDTIALDPGEALNALDVVNAFQELGGERSDTSSDGPEVQKSVAQFDAVQVLSDLHQCSRGFFLGGMRPGTQVQVLQGSAVIGTGVAVDGTAFITVTDGLPLVGSGVLIARQLICPKPPPMPPASAYQVDSPLPAVDPFPYHAGQTLPAPSIDKGLTACSRSVFITKIEPGADVILEGTDRGWWASHGSSDYTSAWLALPVMLRDGERVAIRQEVARRCELTFERKSLTVGPQQKLGKPGLAQIDCNTSPTIYLLAKPEADIEFSVTTNGVETLYRSSATDSYGPVPAPPMPPNSTVRVRQGECGLWSDWSDPQTAKPMTVPPSGLRLPYELFSCQDAVFVRKIFPLNGFVRVISAKHGELNRAPPSGDQMVISVAPSLTASDEVWVEHQVCGFVARSEVRRVRQRSDVTPGTIRGPLFDGDTTVVLADAVAGARIELWEKLKNTMLAQVRAPFSDTGRVTFNISGFGVLHADWQVFAKTLHCGQYVQTPAVGVTFKAPKLTSIVPSTANAGSGAFILTAKGTDFRAGAKVQWNSVDRATTFVSATELHASIPAADVSSVRAVQVRVVNADGQASGTMTFAVVTPPPPPVVGYDELVIQNCNTGTFPSSTVHRPIHIYFRRTDLGPPGPWIPINDSPHNADYDSSGHCPASGSGARFALDNGATYEVVCTDWDLPGCMSDNPNELTCRKSAVMVVHGKAGGGAKTVIIN